MRQKDTYQRRRAEEAAVRRVGVALGVDRRMAQAIAVAARRRGITVRVLVDGLGWSASSIHRWTRHGGADQLMVAAAGAALDATMKERTDA